MNSIRLKNENSGYMTKNYFKNTQSIHSCARPVPA